MEDPQNETSNKDFIMEVEIPVDDPSSTPREMACGHHHGLTRQQSMSRTPSASCLCSPTTHVGSFRCRLHRSPSLNKSSSFQNRPSLQRTKSSMEYGSSSPRQGRIEATSKPAAG
ncbi:hypothetical protein RchiOBHm_Chr4g0433081 [Rosa chinensis]|uniref:Uncharacterized protein n=1 Tax=Rosa chinensis TaxID=74649 RepID=A0A2P6R151_ROSCH|nr:hypothetical protein RchiOBHm_Chr4g0433081 [Rosa chinensis]